MCFIATSNLLTRQLVNSSTRSYVTMSSSQATCLLVNSSTRLLVNLTHLILEVNSLHAIADSRQYLIWNRVKRIAENSDREVVAEDFDTVTFLAIDASNVNHRYVHTDVTDVLCLLTIHQTVAVGGCPNGGLSRQRSRLELLQSHCHGRLFPCENSLPCHQLVRYAAAGW